jgi:hypothetical protein
MPEPIEAPPATRPRRCANHPAIASAGACARCGRSLCAVCATPVRGSLIGPECLAAILDEGTPSAPPTLVVPSRGDALTIAGFAIVVLTSVLPWSRFGDSSRVFAAWTLHWSLVAVAGALIGLAAALYAWRRPLRPLAAATVTGALGVVVFVAAQLHYQHPPPLSIGSPAPLLATMGAAIAVIGAVLKALAVVRAGRVGVGPGSLR